MNFWKNKTGREIIVIVYTWFCVLAALFAWSYLIYTIIDGMILDDQCYDSCERKYRLKGEAVPWVGHDVCVCWPVSGSPIYFLYKE